MTCVGERLAGKVRTAVLSITRDVSVEELALCINPPTKTQTGDYVNAVLMFGSCLCAFMMGQFLLMSHFPPTISPALHHPLQTLSDANLRVGSTSRDDRRGGRRREGNRGRGVRMRRAAQGWEERESGRAPRVTSVSLLLVEESCFKRSSLALFPRVQPIISVHLDE